MKRMNGFICGFLIVFLAGLTCVFGQDFGIDAQRLQNDTGQPIVRVRVDIPEKHVIYEESFSVTAEAEGRLGEPLTMLPVELIDDRFSGEQKHVFNRSFSVDYPVEKEGSALNVLVRWQGCDDTLCFFPSKKSFDLSVQDAEPNAADGRIAVMSEAGAELLSWQNLLTNFTVRKTGSGYMGVADFLAWLSGTAASGTDLGDILAERGLVMVILLILAGGLSLNLTPCVLPMLPINLAIIGAGAQAQSRSRGFLLGGMYGLAIALTYGALGLLVVLAGSTFGAMNASPWFNFAIAIVFILLALSMFDLLHIDFSRFQGNVDTTRQKNKFILAFTMGTVAALLAGACVAPAVISVLVLAGKMYSSGIWAGLLLPFVLGLGMALPWPFAGAGLSFLPRPGGWMVWVRNGFGVLILLMALYYGHLGYTLLEKPAVSVLETGGEHASGDIGEEISRLEQGLLAALQDGRPVFIDFRASWCKNCLAMEKTTFEDEKVKEALNTFHVIKLAAEDASDPQTKALLSQFGALGLPTYVILDVR